MRKLQEELYDLYSIINNAEAISSRRIEIAGACGAFGREKKYVRIFLGRHEGNRLLNAH